MIQRWRAKMDNDQVKCYEAEWNFLSTPALPVKEFTSVDEVSRFAKRIYKSKTWAALWEDSINEDFSRLFNSYPAIIPMAQNTDEFGGQTDGTTVYLNTDTGMNLYTLLHELAHTLGHMDHGEKFRSCLLALVGRFMGSAQRRELSDQFKLQQLG